MTRGSFLQQLRRDQGTIGLAVAWVLLLQILLGLLPQQVLADAMAGGELCSYGAASGEGQQPQPGGGHHQQHCILCGAACTMAGYAAAGTAPDAFGLDGPQLATEISGDPTAATATGLNSRYPSDIDSRGPPARA
jgi:hypothetical protein